MMNPGVEKHFCYTSAFKDLYQCTKHLPGEDKSDLKFEVN
jgi:hypothetical protein